VLQEAAACGLPVVCGAQTAQADDRLAPLLHPVPIDDRHPNEAANCVLQALRAAIAEDRHDRFTQIGNWYSWSRASELYLDLIDNIASGQVAVRDGAAVPTFSAVGPDS
jgi:hypothetical protein